MPNEEPASHTLGPWNYTVKNPDRNEMTVIHKEGDRDFVIGYAIADSNPYQRQQDIANARLMAAAPELLQACIAARQVLASIGSPFVVKQITAAIERAGASLE